MAKLSRDELEALREELRAEVERLTTGLSREDLSDPDRIDASVEAMVALRAVHKRLGVAEALLAEISR